MAEKERSTPQARREKRAREREIKAAEEEGKLSLDFLKGRKAARKRGRKRGS